MLKKLVSTTKKEMNKKSKAQSLVEYGLILALVSVVAITVLQTMGGQIKTTVTNINSQLTNANNISSNAASSP